MTRIAYLDESQRRGSYAIAAFAIPHGSVRLARMMVRSVAVTDGRRRRHFVKEEDRDRKQMLTTFRDLPGASVVCISANPTSVPACRAELLGVLVGHLLVGGLDRIVLDHVDDNTQRRDRRVLVKTLRGTRISYGFEPPHSTEMMLWVPDAVAWCAGRNEWRHELRDWVTTIAVP